MPGINPKYDVNDKAVNEAGDNERVDRAAMINSAWAYYAGRHVKPLKIENGKRDDNVIMNLCGRALDKSVEFLGVPRSIEVPGGVQREPVSGQLVEQRSPDQEQLDFFWQENEIDTFVPDLALSGAISGHSFVRLFVIDEDMDAPMAALIDPRMMTVFWDASNVKRMLFYRLQWMLGDETRRQDIVPNRLANVDGGDGWQIIEYVQNRGGTKWIEVARDKWEYSFSPIVEIKNKRMPHQYYGVSDLVVAGLNDSVNFVASNTARIIRFHAHPKTVAIGIDADQVEPTAIDSFWAIPVEGASIQNIEMQSDLQSSMKMLETLKAEFFASMRVVDVASIKDKLGQVTNFGVRMIFSDMMEMIDDKRRNYGAGLAEISRRGLAMMGATLIQQRPVVHWADPLPVNRLEQLQAAQIEKALGTVSEQMLADDLGRDYDMVVEQKAEETANAGEALGRVLENVAIRGL